MRRVDLTESEWKRLVALLEEATGPGTWYVDPCCDDHFPQAMRRDIGQAKNKLLAAERPWQSKLCLRPPHLPQARAARGEQHGLVQ